MPKPKTILSAEHITKSFSVRGKQVPVLADVNLSVIEGEFLCILGRSGEGKSTLLRILAGFEKQDSGIVIIDNVEKKNANLEVVMVFQDFNQIFPWKTVKGNVVHTLLATRRATTRAEASERADQIIQDVALGGYEDYYPHQLSGGMSQRAAVARALVLEPRILLMDEPFAALDTQTRKALQLLTKRICAEKKLTTIFVTHNIDEAAELADRVIILSKQLQQTQLRIVKGEKSIVGKESLIRALSAIIHERE
ncbi:MAG: ABC transporter ATP-binding protein [Candidatus Saccharimonadales bacterium]